MAYFPDLSPYEYGHGIHHNVVNVGWLCCAHDYSKGQSAPHVLTKLKKLVCHPVNLTRGFHVCDFCPKDISHHLHPEMRGNGEIHITVRQFATLEGRSTLPIVTKSNLLFTQKRTYAAPVLIVHYIESHGYLPPMEFLKALEDVPI